MESIGKTIKKYRKRMKLTQVQLAFYAKVSPKFIIELENDKPTIQLNKLYDVLNVFDLTLNVVSKKELNNK